MNTQLKEHTGGCFCGQIRYRVLGEPLWVGHCHCSKCRRISGAAFTSWAYFEKSNFSLSDEPTTFKSSEWGERSFCTRCGTPLIYEDTKFPDYIGVTLGSLDDPNEFSPQDHVQTSSRLRWLHLNDGLPEYPKEHPMQAEYAQST